MGVNSVPVKVKANGRASRVAAVDDRWKVEDEWWREVPVSRIYYGVVLESGHSFTLFHDMVTGRWFRQSS